MSGLRTNDAELRELGLSPKSQALVMPKQDRPAPAPTPDTDVGAALAQRRAAAELCVAARAVHAAASVLAQQAERQPKRPKCVEVTVTSRRPDGLAETFRVTPTYED